MGKTTDLRRVIRQNFIPYMKERGFHPDLRHMPRLLDFRRITPQQIFVCDIQWEKYGRPRFVLNFGSCGPHGVICHGEQINPTDVTPSVTPRQGRLQPGRSASVSNWFRQNRGLLQRIWKGSRLKPPDEVVRNLIELFPEVENYWENGTIGEHVRLHPVRWSADRDNPS